ncbi:hypothetical protein MOO44_08335 [Nicoliella spurrieriana]|uniref:Uncharacterized protein n=1 Tax=Nicoliella spurrieriana TaxID=2925830 RepID=A0A976RS66_9LACO|nr:hypothetical protein [Nicoliella spurrieriana]UQS86857.1 hypothetical protein MOO44_08335 [Nicoliella spurrieriana]
MKLKHIAISAIASLSLFALTPNLHNNANAATWHKGLPKVLYGNWISGYQLAKHTGSKYVRVSVQTSKQDDTFVPFQTMYNSSKKEVEKNKEADFSDYSDQKYQQLNKNTYYITSGKDNHTSPLQKYTVVMNGKNHFTVSGKLVYSKTVKTEYQGQKISLTKVKRSAIPLD